MEDVPMCEGESVGAKEGREARMAYFTLGTANIMNYKAAC